MPEVMINGPAGRLEGHFSAGQGPEAPVALLLHPHPLYGGHMNSRVVQVLADGFARQGCAVLRFNFRGVGGSQGSFSRGAGELADAAAALDWLQAAHPAARLCWVGGYSFGAWICLQLLMRRPEIDRFVAVAPPANLYDFGFLAPCPASGLIMQGDQDSVVPEPVVARLVKKLAMQPHIRIDYRPLAGADHFFEDHLGLLAGHLDAHLEAALRTP